MFPCPLSKFKTRTPCRSVGSKKRPCQLSNLTLGPLLYESWILILFFFWFVYLENCILVQDIVRYRNTLIHMTQLKASWRRVHATTKAAFGGLQGHLIDQHTSNIIWPIWRVTLWTCCLSVCFVVSYVHVLHFFYNVVLLESVVRYRTCTYGKSLLIISTWHSWKLAEGESIQRKCTHKNELHVVVEEKSKWTSSCLHVHVLLIENIQTEG